MHVQTPTLISDPRNGNSHCHCPVSKTLTQVWQRRCLSSSTSSTTHAKRVFDLSPVYVRHSLDHDYHAGDSVYRRQRVCHHSTLHVSCILEIVCPTHLEHCQAHQMTHLGHPRRRAGSCQSRRRLARPCTRP